MTLDELAYTLLNIANPKRMDDDNVSLRQVKNWIVSTRALFLTTQLNKGVPIDYNMSQTIPEVPLEFLETSHNSSSVFRSKKKIPQIITTHMGPALISIGDKRKDSSAVTRVGYSYKILRTAQEAYVAGHGRFNHSMVFTYLDNGYLYVKTGDVMYPMVSKLNVFLTGVFADPRSLKDYTDSEGKPLFSDKYVQFPMDESFVNYLQTEILNSKFSIVEPNVPDDVQDGNEQQNRPPRQENPSISSPDGTA